MSINIPTSIKCLNGGKSRNDDANIDAKRALLIYVVYFLYPPLYF